MIFRFNTGDVTFFDDDQAYFENKLSNLKKFLKKADEQNPDVIDVKVNMKKTRHTSGERFECSVTITCPHHGKFHADVSAENIKKCADEIYEKLRPQVKKFQETR